MFCGNQWHVGERNEERLREYTDAALPRLEQVTKAARPLDPDLEEQLRRAQGLVDEPALIPEISRP